VAALAVFSCLLQIPSPGFGRTDHWANPRVTGRALKQFQLDRAFHRCVSVADGDTIELEGIGSVRFMGIDTPEKNHPGLPVQYLAQEASAFTARHCLEQMVRLDYDHHDRDFRGKYGRVLGYVFLGDGTFLQEKLVRNGLAAVYTRYPMDESIKQRLLAAEKQARQDGAGLWQDQGFAEVQWLFKNKTRMIRVGFTDCGNYEISTAGWSLHPVPAGRVAERIDQLHRWMYAFSAHDFNHHARAAGYQGRKKPAADRHLLIFPMAHKKWGAYYNGYACPRIDPLDLENWIKRFCDAMLNPSDHDQVHVRLLELGFRFFQDLDYHPLDPTTDALPSGNHQLQSLPKSGPVVAWYRAGEHIGKNAWVHGRIVRTDHSGKACFLNFHNNYRRYMSAVIFASDTAKFPDPPESWYLGRYVAVRGKIKTYEAKPEIVIDDPGQIIILDQTN
jgi:endonuclease YncB( thermonuclease family)